MFNLCEILKSSDKSLISKDKIAKLLHSNPEALKQFEQTYSSLCISEDDNRHTISAKQAIFMNSKEVAIDETILINRIVKELLDKTYVYVYSGSSYGNFELPKLSNGTPHLTPEDLSGINPDMRPQLTGDCMLRDILPEERSYETVLMYYALFSDKTKSKDIRKDAYHRFRQGLDILDIDPILYEIIGMNPNSIGHWFPELVAANAKHDFFKIPKTKIMKVPLTLLQLTRLEYNSLTPATIKIVDEFIHEAFNLDDTKDYFIKTGTYSSKFDFRNTHVHGPKEVEELGEYLLFIHWQALQMASPLCSPCIYGVSTTNEWVVREFIQDREDNPCIYHGMPLHTEYRIFIDCDKKEIIGSHEYWDPETMKHRFSQEDDSNTPDKMHDYVIFKAHEDILTNRYRTNIKHVCNEIIKLLPDMNLHGQWSIDIMQNGNDFYLIDMALAENSAFYDCVPANKRIRTEENWIPKLN